MTYEMADMIRDIGRMDDYRRSMMDELKLLRDVTLFYNERYPELRSAARNRAEDADDKGNTGSDTSKPPVRPATDGGNERSATDATGNQPTTPPPQERAGQSPTPTATTTSDDPPGQAARDTGSTHKGDQQPN